MSAPDPTRAKAAVDALRGVYARTQQKPAKPEGRRLATCSRGESGELRLSLEAFEGKDYLSLRVWQRNEDTWIPTKKGVSIRLHEIPALMDGLVIVAEEAHARMEREGGAE